MTGEWTPEPFEADDASIPFERFLNDLSNFKVDAVTVAIDRLLTVQGIDLVRTEWLKALGEGPHEFRIRHTAAEVARLFGGYDKGDDPKERRQQREIQAARRLLTQFRERQRRTAR
jgi:hypothetical protein